MVVLNVIWLIFELGGKLLLIVFEDVDLEKVVDGVFWVIFFNLG